MIQNFKLTIEYDGSAYCGWQRQKNDPTIQEKIESALFKITSQKIPLKGSGRTDAGVHAYGQVASFSCHTSLTPDVFLKGLNSLIPGDIVIRCCEKVSEDFHARYSAVCKTYAYRILNTMLPVAIGRHYAWHIRQPLDLNAMDDALRYIVGTHDFKAFEGTGSPRNHTVRNMISAALTKTDSEYLTFEFKANGFLRFMVRNLVGTLVDVGVGRLSSEDFNRILQSKDRNQAGATAPPHGLFLMQVEY
jgi:tRNA pseudouridine38-40 synthase